MASAFKNRTLRAVGTSPTDIGAAVASSTEVTVIGLSLANITASGAKATVTINDGTNTTHIVKDAAVPAEASLVVVGGDMKLVMMTGDKLIVTSDTASSIDVHMSYLEIT